MAAGKLIDKKFYKVFPGKEKVGKKDAEEKKEKPDFDTDKKMGADDLADGSAAKDRKSIDRPTEESPDGKFINRSKEKAPKGSKGS